jgi:PAS domain S-box-containing protein
MPARWRQPWMGYLLALVSSAFFASMTILLIILFPALNLRGVLLIAGIVAVALTWGAGPSLLATFVSTWLLEFVVIPLQSSWQFNQPGPWVDGGIHLASWIGVSLLASQSGWARRRAEALACALKKAQASSDLERLRLRALVETLPAPVAMVDAQERVLEFNPAAQAFWGAVMPQPRTIADFQAMKGRSAITGQPLAPQAWAVARAMLTGERVANEEVEIEADDGQRKIMLDSAIPIRDANGAIHGAVGVLQDITERKRLEDALRQAERAAAARARELEAIFEALTDGLMVYDAEGRILRSNTAARQLLGFDAHPEFVTLPWKERATRYTPLDARGQPILPDDLALSRLLRGEVLTGTQTAEDCLHTPDGREVTFSMTGRPMRDAEGEIMGAVGIVRDVTEHRRLERQTREALNALLAMAEALVQGDEQAAQGVRASVPALRSRADPALAVVAERLAELTRRVLNCWFVSITAIDPATGALTPITVVGLTPEDEQRWWARWGGQAQTGLRLPASAVAALSLGETVLPGRLPALPSWWQLLPLAHSSVLVPMRVGETLVGVLRIDGSAQEEEQPDSGRQALIMAVARLGALVLERERLLRERAQAQANELALRETQAQMETFLGIAGHELKNPLTSIKLSLQLTERHIHRAARQESGAARNPALFLEQVVRAGNQANRLERLVNELLDASRVQAGKLDFHLEPTDLAAIVGEAVEEQRQANPDRALTLHLPPDRAVPVVADADRIGQVVTNYLTNALKYSPADCPVAVGLDVEKEQTRVWVRDEGPGLPPEEQERIWERFHRARGIEVQSGTGVGLGLGLHICRTIIERHHGQVGVESAPGQGSTFWFTLPPGEQEGGQSIGVALK